MHKLEAGEGADTAGGEASVETAAQGEGEEKGGAGAEAEIEAEAEGRKASVRAQVDVRLDSLNEELEDDRLARELARTARPGGCS